MKGVGDEDSGDGEGMVKRVATLGIMTGVRSFF